MGQILDFWGHFEKDILKILSDISLFYHLYPPYQNLITHVDTYHNHQFRRNTFVFYFSRKVWSHLQKKSEA